MKHRKIVKDLILLFASFFQMGLFTYGGGGSLIAQIQQKYVDRRKVITAEDLLDLVSVGKSIPGKSIPLMIPAESADRVDNPVHFP